MMDSYEVIVVGGGHAGIEASHASAKMGHRTLLLTLDKKMIGNMPCNPHIGGSAKGVVVREVDALGGLMGLAADEHPLQIKMLNTGKGPGVRCLRSQQDKYGYPKIIQGMLMKTPNLDIEEGEAIDVLWDEGSVKGVRLSDGKEILCKALILTTGTYLDSRIIKGEEIYQGGPDDQKCAHGLSDSLAKKGISLFRLKTGTPPRIKKSTIDFSKAEIQLGEDGDLAFSYRSHNRTPLSKQLPCYLIYTNEKTHKLILDNIDESALFNGTMTSIGPRYCPSIESKIVRFSDKPRHQLFLEPETEDGESIYLQGFSTAMPKALQEKMVHTLPGLENAELLRYAYQIEYDAIDPLQFDSSLAVKGLKGLYGAGQICGTSGYEEAAGLGIMAGINASLFLEGKEPFVLKRSEAYIGVMIDDLVTKGADEPYRLLSSRAEYRLLLRHDNADKRLSEYGHKYGLLSEEEYSSFVEKYKKIDQAIEILAKTNVSDKDKLNEYFASLGLPPSNDGFKGIELLKRPFFHYREIASCMPELSEFAFSDEEVLCLETAVKYVGYIKKEEKEAASLLKEEKMALPSDLDYLHMDGLRLEARQKLDKVRPVSIAQASRIPGVNPADISILLLTLRKEKRL